MSDPFQPQHGVALVLLVRLLSYQQLYQYLQQSPGLLPGQYVSIKGKDTRLVGRSGDWSGRRDSVVDSSADDE